MWYDAFIYVTYLVHMLICMTRLIHDSIISVVIWWVLWYNAFWRIPMCDVIHSCVSFAEYRLFYRALLQKRPIWHDWMNAAGIRKYQSCHRNKWVTLHTWMSHDHHFTNLNELCLNDAGHISGDVHVHTYRFMVISQLWTSHITHMKH